MQDFLIAPSIFYLYVMPNMTRAKAYKWLGIIDWLMMAVERQINAIQKEHWAAGWPYPTDKLKTQYRNLEHMKNSINLWLEHGHSTSLN